MNQEFDSIIINTKESEKEKKNYKFVIYELHMYINSGLRKEKKKKFFIFIPYRWDFSHTHTHTTTCFFSLTKEKTTIRQSLIEIFPFFSMMIDDWIIYNGWMIDRTNHTHTLLWTPRIGVYPLYDTMDWMIVSAEEKW